MSFPSKINTKISGNLKLTIASPKAEFQVPIDDVQINPPLGFSINRGLKEQVAESVTQAKKRFEEIVEKSLTCKNSNVVTVVH